MAKRYRVTLTTDECASALPRMGCSCPAAPAKPSRLRAQAGRVAGSAADRHGLLRPAGRQEALGAAAAAKRRSRLRVAERMVALEVVSDLSHETVRQVLGGNALKPHLRQMWCIPPQQSAGFVCHVEPRGSPDMGDVLDVYCRPADPRRPVVCLDELSAQPVGEVRAPLPVRPGQAARHDSEYVRHGTADLFLRNRNGLRRAFEPPGGWRGVQVTERRPRGDWARFVRDLVDNRHKDADKVVLIMDPGRKRFAFRRAHHPRRGLAPRSVPARRGQARRGHAGNPPHPQRRALADRCAMAEIALSVFRRDLPERVASKATL